MVMSALGAIGSAAAPYVARAAGNAIGSAVSGATGNVGAQAATMGGTQGTGDEILRIQKQYGVSPQQATAMASEIQERERNAQSRMAQGSIYENAALQNRIANLDVQRGGILNAQAQQAALGSQLVNSVQAARDAATNAVMQGAQLAAGMTRGAIR